MFKRNPGLILDGELYWHGKPLNIISGLCRKETLEEDHKNLKFYCYDIVDEVTPFSMRVARLGEFRRNCPENSKLVIIDQVPVRGLDEIQKYHDDAVAEGYEGAVLKDPEKPYKCGARDQRCLKLKEFTEGTFKVLGIQQGLRHIDDMVFVLETEDGKPFNAKPLGDHAQKEEYTNNFETKYMGHMGEVKYFYRSPDGIPLLPVFRSFRFDIEND